MSKKITRPCETCGKEVTRYKYEMREHVFCNRQCSKPFLSKRFTELNLELNPERMIPETRKKLRNHRLGTGEGKSYEKTFSRHTHRIEAEKMLGRPLKKGEVVHHIDGNKRNNQHNNLFVFKSQAEHARAHQLILKMNGPK